MNNADEDPKYRCECFDPNCSCHQGSIHCPNGGMLGVITANNDGSNEPLVTYICEHCYDDAVASGVLVEDEMGFCVWTKEPTYLPED